MNSKKTNRRKFLKSGAAAGLAVSAMQSAAGQKPKSVLPDAKSQEALKQLVAYGDRSRYVTSVRIPAPGRTSPDQFGLIFHIGTPLQDSTGIITPNSLHFVGTHEGSIVPDINPAEYRLLIHGLVDHPMEFTLADLKRLPSVSRIHFVECTSNRASAASKTVQETHGLVSCAEWTGVLLSLLLKQVGVQKNASWIVAEGAEEVKGAGSLPLEKAMEDCIVCYGQNGEPVRPQNGYPVRLIVPGFEGIYNTKWLRRIKLVDRYYMTYNDYGHVQRDPKRAALGLRWGPKSVITYPSGGQQLSGPGFYWISGLAWSGGGVVKKVEISTDNGQTWKDAELQGPLHRMALTRFGFAWNWNGQECVLQSRCTDELGQIQPTRTQLGKFLNMKPGTYDTMPMLPYDSGTDNTIQPWKVAADGSVHNALA